MTQVLTLKRLLRKEANLFSDAILYGLGGAGLGGLGYGGYGAYTGYKSHQANEPRMHEERLGRLLNLQAQQAPPDIVDPVAYRVQNPPGPSRAIWREGGERAGSGALLGAGAGVAAAVLKHLLGGDDRRRRYYV